MSEHDLKEALASADEALARPRTSVPSLADLERRERVKLVRRGGAALLVAAVAATAHWTASLSSSRSTSANGAMMTSVLGSGSVAAFRADLDEHLASFGDAIAELRRTRSSAAEPRQGRDEVEASALGGFRALHASAAAGDESSIESLRWIAIRFEDTHGGRCARVFLDGLAEGPAEPAFPGDAR